jgi:hypothetical protein
VDEKVGRGLARKLALQLGAVGSVRREDLVRFIGQSSRRFL